MTADYVKSAVAAARKEQDRMESKTFEIRDRGTFIPVLAVRLIPGCEADRYLIARAGYGRTSREQGTNILLTRLTDAETHHDPVEWLRSGTRSMYVAHQEITKKWGELSSGVVIDVEYVLGETYVPKDSEAITNGLLVRAGD